MQIYQTRLDFLNALPHNCICAEIGVNACANATNILKINQPTQFILIDVWKDLGIKAGGDMYKPYPELEEKHYNIAKGLEKDNECVVVHRMLSLDAAKLYDDFYFDWVYIDACHQYEYCLADLNAWFPKVKKGGFIAGHDYTDSEENKRSGFGVKRAVDEFMETNNLTLSFISDVKKATDYAIQKDFK